MGSMKESPRYEVLSARVSDQELVEVQSFASEHEITVSEATRRLIVAGLEAMEPN